jgi:hypothetical protein
MNACDEFQVLLNAALDGELESDDRAALDAHLVVCADCRETAAALHAQDAALRRGFSPLRRQADAVAQRVIAAHLAAPSPPRRTVAVLRRAAVLAASAAAGFLLAFIVTGRRDGRESQDDGGGQANSGHVSPVARLVAATGDVRTRQDDADQWTTVLPGQPLSAGCRISTPPDVRCEFEIPGAGVVRVNQGSELGIEPGGGVSLHAGQMYCSPSGDGITVCAGDSQFVCRGGPVQLTKEGQQPSVQVAAAAAAEVVVGGQPTRLASREQVLVQGTTVAAAAPLDDAVLETNWVAALLVGRGGEDDLTSRVHELCAGLEKPAPVAEPRYEQALRSLGYRCVEPLAEFVGSAESQGSPLRRVAAARILCDLAQPWQSPLLIELVDDADGQVRFAACSALRRLSGETIGLSPSDSQGAPLVVCRNDRDEWSQWWKTYCREHPASAVAATEVGLASRTNSTLQTPFTQEAP